MDLRKELNIRYRRVERYHQLITLACKSISDCGNPLNPRQIKECDDLLKDYLDASLFLEQAPKDLRRKVIRGKTEPEREEAMCELESFNRLSDRLYGLLSHIGFHHAKLADLPRKI